MNSIFIKIKKAFFFFYNFQILNQKIVEIAEFSYFLLNENLMGLKEKSITGLKLPRQRNLFDLMKNFVRWRGSTYSPVITNLMLLY